MIYEYINKEFDFYYPKRIIKAYNDIKHKILNNQMFMNLVNGFNSKEDIYGEFINVVNDYVLDLIPNNIDNTNQLELYNIMTQQTFFPIWSKSMFDEIYKIYNLNNNKS